MDLGAFTDLDFFRNCFISIDHPGPGDLPREQMKQLSTPAQRVLEAITLAGFEDEELIAAAFRAMALYCKRDALLLLSVAEELEEAYD